MRMIPLREGNDYHRILLVFAYSPFMSVVAMKFEPLSMNTTNRFSY